MCGLDWLQTFLDSSDLKLPQVQQSDSNSSFKFGTGDPVKALYSVRLPIYIGDKHVYLNTDVIDEKIPLLFSKESLKRADSKIDFVQDIITLFNQNINLIITTTGHYAIPITINSHIIHSKNQPHNITLASNLTNKNDIAQKLHRQFAHPTYERLIKLLKSAAPPWNDDVELFDLIKKYSDSCEICKKYKRPHLIPSVSLPIATKFNQCLAMDLKFYTEHILLHIIDYASRYSVSSRIPSKRSEVIIKEIMSKWIAVFGSPGAIFSDNGGEFANEDFLNMAHSFNINILVSAANSPFSNGVVERHNGILANILDRILGDTKCNFDIALAWAINAKNSLTNIHGFSAYQLAIGYNPILPNNFNSKLPALTSEHANNLINENLKFLHNARKAYLEAESSERIKRALSTKIRTSSEQIFLPGDKIYYRRTQDKQWRGPAYVIGRYNKQFLIKHGSFHYRVHHCNMTHATNDQHKKPYNPENDEINVNNNKKIEDIQGLNDDTQESNNNNNNNHEYDNEDEINENDNKDETNEIPPQKFKPTQEEDTSNNQIELDIERNTSENQTENPETNEKNSSINTKEDPSNTNIELKDFTIPIEPIEKKYTERLNDPSHIKINDIITWRNINDDNWKTGKIVNRAAKSSSKKWKDSWNIEVNDGSKQFVKLTADDIEYKKIYHETEYVTHSILLASLRDDQNEAKTKELNSWKNQNVYEEINDQNQPCVSVRWVITPKLTDGKWKTKARLCAKGYEEDSFCRTDSPTSTKEGLRLAFCAIASKKWSIHSIDVKTAFLQGSPIDREIYIRPPPEANTNKIWKLLKCVYGLNDASRKWYLRLREVLIKLEASPSKLDQGIFMFFDTNNELFGLITVWVDDVIWAGTPLFNDNIISKLKQTFSFGFESERAFTYIGINITQIKNEIYIDQNSYINSIEYIKISPDKKMNNKYEILNKTKNTEFRGKIGQLNWLSTISRLDLAMQTRYASALVTTATTKDAIFVNKIIKQAKNTRYSIKFPSFNLETLILITYTDASYNNLPNGGSQGSYIVFLSDGNNSAPIRWHSGKLKRKVKSTLAAETVALSEGCDASYYTYKLLHEMLQPTYCIEQHVYTDNESLFKTASTTHLVDDLRLRVELSAIRELISKNEIFLHWIDSKFQLADCLTKLGAPNSLLIETISQGKNVYSL